MKNPKNTFPANTKYIPNPTWAVGFALEQTLRNATLAVFSFLILKRLQHTCPCPKNQHTQKRLYILID
ncbi:MAG: hypothetical protein LBH59_11625 [Planctomycetaceae bacterium]|nr:hypothetical protein [Planctomycetaceae bacterium]